jgi:hypothetical protein
MSAADFDVLTFMRLVVALAAGGLFACLVYAWRKRIVDGRDLLAALTMAAHAFIYRLYVLLVLDLNLWGTHFLPGGMIEMWATLAYLHGIITFLGYVLLVIHRGKGEV